MPTRQFNTVAAGEFKDVYTKVTDRIVADLEKGERPWLRPWNAGNTTGRITKPLRYNGLPYGGINVLMLWAEAVTKGYANPKWMTFKQAQELGGHVRKGERGSLVVYASTIHKTGKNEETGEDVEQNIPFLKGYTVFNVEQIDALPELYYEKPPPAPAGMERIATVEAFFAHTKAVIRHGGDTAYYTQEADSIQMPPFESFTDEKAYYSTLAHEAIHWTKHPSRLDRSFGAKRWGDEGYAVEELVAELGSAFLGADLGIEPEVRDDHAAYIGAWLKVLKSDKRAIFTAASHAQRAADHLQSMQPNPVPDPPVPDPYERMQSGAFPVADGPDFA